MTKLQDPVGTKVTDDERYLNRRQLADRWGVGIWTIINRERDGVITPVRFNSVNVRYRLSEIQRIEEEANTARPDSKELRRRKRLGAKLVAARRNREVTP